MLLRSLVVGLLLAAAVATDTSSICDALEGCEAPPIQQPTASDSNHAGDFKDTGTRHGFTVPGACLGPAVLKQRIGELEGQLSNVREDLLATTGQMAGLKTMLQGKVKALAAENTQLKVLVSELELQIDVNQRDLAVLHDKVRAKDNHATWQATVASSVNTAWQTSKRAVNTAGSKAKDLYDAHIRPTGIEAVSQATSLAKTAAVMYTKHASKHVDSVIDHVKTTASQQYAAHAPKVKDAFATVVAKVEQLVQTDPA
ncbi:hypothetical protein H257_07616 [Aphanomyces astaci]|uniref:Uncharacterized protein n=1 Tax=Aphanomyces astaci TaxID=112090 RepID=W4GGH4_APHAT|nr:hypothetical protein H257_07616 [Aphanomyces astaci]ETV78785.1 hypothetical protein H257_07616 [Aphanomyces astaci]|eukprot:XP_009831504.1 hypothetical protein H257_07616 [Aphanomyces astaci]